MIAPDPAFIPGARVRHITGDTGTVLRCETQYVVVRDHRGAECRWLISNTELAE